MIILLFMDQPSNPKGGATAFAIGRGAGSLFFLIREICSILDPYESKTQPFTGTKFSSNRLCDISFGLSFQVSYALKIGRLHCCNCKISICNCGKFWPKVPVKIAAN